MGKPQQKKAKLASPKEKTFVLSSETEDNVKTEKFTTENNLKADHELGSQPNELIDSTSFNWANITERELQGSEIWEDILSEQVKTCKDTTEETNNTRQNNNETNTKHVPDTKISNTCLIKIINQMRRSKVPILGPRSTSWNPSLQAL